jgi:DNA topoisomerase-1
MKLLIVESPTKATRIATFMGKEWQVEASRGHLRDLPENDLGVDIKNDFALNYQLLADHRGTLIRLKKLVAEAEAVYLATDPDREGEAVAWHLAELLKTALRKTPVYRVRFNAITQSAIFAGIESAGQIDQALVEAQQARRTLDRLVGYLVSPLVRQKLNGRYSAGRVQSACLRLIVEREEAIKDFTDSAYWTVDAKFNVNDLAFSARLSGLRDFRTTRWPQTVIKPLGDGLREATFTVAEFNQRDITRRPLPPFITSTLQQAASKAFHFSPDQTMQLAQSLYERGLITYMRTDSVSVAPEGIEAARRFIESEYGAPYVPTLPQRYVPANDSAQEGHEAIRPTDITARPETLPSGDGRSLYLLIWKRFVASQMADARYNTQGATINASKKLDAHSQAQFTARGLNQLFDGFLRVYHEPLDDGEKPFINTALPTLTVGQDLKLAALVPMERKIDQPKRYTDASLVGVLEAEGIGRPSTYASTLRLLHDKGYVKSEDRRLAPTPAGTLLNAYLVAAFPALFESEFTAKLETQLDQIATGKTDRLAVLNEFWQAFSPRYESLTKQYLPAPSTKTSAKTPKVLGVCPNCGANLIEHRSKSGVFASCEHFPKCKGRAPVMTFTAASKGAL